MNKTNRLQEGGFYNSICSCDKCSHKRAPECFKLKCNCCKASEHSMIMDGIEEFEQKT